MILQTTTSKDLQSKAVKMSEPTLKAFILNNIKEGPGGVHTKDLWAAYLKINGRTVLGRTQFTRALCEDMAAMGYAEDRALKLGSVTKRGYKGVMLCNT